MKIGDRPYLLRATPKTHNSIPQSNESIGWMRLCKPHSQLGYAINR